MDWLDTVKIGVPGLGVCFALWTVYLNKRRGMEYPVIRLMKYAPQDGAVEIENFGDGVARDIRFIKIKSSVSDIANYEIMFSANQVFKGKPERVNVSIMRDGMAIRLFEEVGYEFYRPSGRFWIRYKNRFDEEFLSEFFIEVRIEDGLKYSFMPSEIVLGKRLYPWSKFWRWYKNADEAN